MINLFLTNIKHLFLRLKFEEYLMYSVTTYLGLLMICQFQTEHVIPGIVIIIFPTVSWILDKKKRKYLLKSISFENKIILVEFWFKKKLIVIELHEKTNYSLSLFELKNERFKKEGIELIIEEEAYKFYPDRVLNQKKIYKIIEQLKSLQ